MTSAATTKDTRNTIMNIKETAIAGAILAMAMPLLGSYPATGITGYDKTFGHGDTVAQDKDESIYGRVIKGRRHVGASLAKMSMDKTTTPHENSFLGNLDTLKEDDTSSVGLSLKYDFCDYLAIVFADDIDASLSAWNYTSASTDGSLELSGYSLMIVGQYPMEVPALKTVATPYAGIGFSDISASWSYKPWWHYGWASPEDYDEHSGGSDKPHNGYSRWMLPSSPSKAATFAAGVSFVVCRHLDLDLSYRVVDLDDVSAKFRSYSPTGRVVREGSFPAKFSALCIALRYVF